MHTIIIDDEENSVKMFKDNISRLSYITLFSFSNPVEALSYAKNNSVELAVINMDMKVEISSKRTDAVELCQELKTLCPNILFVFVCKCDRFARQAIRLKAADYLIKPVTRESAEYAMESARLLLGRYSKRVYAKTFGHFDIFVDGKPIMFRSKKAKEMLAFLIDRRGGVVTTEQIISVMWENRPNDEATQSLCSKVAGTLRKELKQISAEDILIFDRGSRRIDTDKLDCDLFNFVTGKEKSGFNGEYLSDYSWAESTLAALNKLVR